MLAITGLTVGADPEVFLVSQKGEPVSAIGRIGGTKDTPKPMEGLGEGFAVQEDNVAAEYNIPAAQTAGQFSKYIADGLRYIQGLAKAQGLKVSCVSSLHFTEEDLKHPMAQQLGCDPDYNVWTRKPNPRPVPPASLRTAAGHVHIGWQTPQPDQQELVIRALDLFLGVPSILVTKADERRSLYGKAGAFRPKPYGAEYRTLGNFWLPNEVDRKYVFNQVFHAVQNINMNSEVMTDLLDDWGPTIQRCINDHNPDLAVSLISELSITAWPIR